MIFFPIKQTVSKTAKISLSLAIYFILLLISLSTDAEEKNTSPNKNAVDFDPFGTRDQNLLNLIHGQPLPSNARLNIKAQSRWSSSLNITNTTNIESNNQESIHLDYESYRFNLSYQYGLTDNWNLKIDVPLIHQSGGIFDSAIENWHDFFGLPRGQRPDIDQDQYAIDYDYQSKSLLNVNETSTSLGDIQIAIARRLLKNKNTSMSLWASIKLPTGNEDKLSGSGATDFSTWLALNQQLSKNWALNLNAGAVILGKDTYQEIPMSDYAVYGHIMLGWLVSDNINLKVQLQGHTSYYDQSQLGILNDSYLLTAGTSITINDCNQLDIAISEDIKVSSSPDISLVINWRSYTSHC